MEISARQAIGNRYASLRSAMGTRPGSLGSSSHGGRPLLSNSLEQQRVVAGCVNLSSLIEPAYARSMEIARPGYWTNLICLDASQLLLTQTWRNASVGVGLSQLESYPEPNGSSLSRRSTAHGWMWLAGPLPPLAV